MENFVHLLTMGKYIIDLIIAIPIIWAAYKGYKDGVWVQLGGIAGVILGVWIGYHFGGAIGAIFDLTGQSAYIVGFITAIIVVLVCSAIISHIIKGLFKISGLSMIDQMGGVMLSIGKILIIIALIVALFDSINSKYNWVEKKTIENSYMYNPMKKGAEKILPFAEDVKNQLFNSQKEE